MRDDPIKLNFVYGKQRSKIMRLQGVDHQCLHGARNNFDVDSTFVKIKNETESDIKSIPVRRQARWLNQLLDQPLRSNPVIAISSYPTDMKAKLIASQIMYKALAYQQNNSGRRKFSQKDFPLWHRVYGGYKDPLRDGSNSEGKKNPSMLIITNVNDDSTQMKIEKVRDLLEMYERIPRIVVLGGVNPMTFFAKRLYYPLKYAIYLGPEKKASAALDI